MNTVYKILESDTDFMIAAMSQAPVSVWHQYNDYAEGRLHDYGGIVEGYHSGMVKIEGNCFRRDRFEFRAYIK
ncbi:hypothetical protein NYE33_14755 [Paenibacillus sp. FSL R10-2199]|uniref:hypothetical protein n=1 Tax=Paenibacillus sp. FSL R10-2199 TaxID=2975348 RepID=UPI0030FB74BB